jgi:hypothetical protein
MQRIAIDYETLELKTMAKSPNFGSPGGMGVGIDSLGAFGTYGCKRCGSSLVGYHDRRRCHYRATSLRYQKLGFVPVTGLLKKALKQADVQLHWGTGLVVGEGPRSKNLHVENWELQRKKRKKASPPELQKTYYAPVWAVLLYDLSGVGALTSPKRPKVRELMDKLKRAAQDPDEVELLMAEHILGTGPYTVACQAMLGRSKR